MKTNKTYQIVITANNVNDLEAAEEAAHELKTKFPGLKVEMYCTKRLN